jgi:endonuclease/exonuclease/phosphatase (EEP) superfamily protein YafD
VVPPGLLRKLPAFAATLFAATAALCLALGALAESFWICDLLTHFRWQYAIALLASGTFFLIQRWFRTGVVSLLLGSVVLISLAAPALAPAPAALDAPTLKVITFNVLKSNERRSAICDFLERENADVVALSEITPEWEPEIRRLQTPYPHVLSSFSDKPKSGNRKSCWLAQVSGVVEDAPNFARTGSSPYG